MAIKDISGKRLERLIAMLESILAGTGAVIESPSRRLIDKDTGRRREHDVLVEWHHGHHHIITAIECRDRGRPVGVPDVEGFADKCRATGVQRGVIVSTKGFRETARIKAAANSITCMELEAVDQFDWLGTEAIVHYQRHFNHTEARIMFKDAQPDALTAIFDTSGNELSEQQILQTITHNVPSTDNPDDELGRVIPVSMRVQTVGWTARDTDGKTWDIDHIEARTSFTVQKTIKPIETHQYIGGGKNYAIASAEAKIGETAGRFVMVRNDDDSTSIYWTPDKHGSSASLNRNCS